MRELLLLTHFIGLAMGLGTSFGFMFLGIAASKLEQEERLRFQKHTMALSRMGHIGLALLLISGSVLMTPYWSILASSPLLIAKLVLVLVLVGLIAIISTVGAKARKGDAAAYSRKLGLLGRVSMLTSIAIVVLAVYFFR